MKHIPRTEENIRIAQAMLDVAEPCPACHGLGRRYYSSGSTWRGGWGVASLTMDVCDQCWGSGEDACPGVDIRRLEAELRKKRHADCADWIAERCGFRWESMQRCALHFADVIEALGRKRKIPDGIGPTEWIAATAVVPKVLREMAESKKGNTEA